MTGMARVLALTPPPPSPTLPSWRKEELEGSQAKRAVSLDSGTAAAINLSARGAARADSIGILQSDFPTLTHPAFTTGHELIDFLMSLKEKYTSPMDHMPVFEPRLIDSLRQATPFILAVDTRHQAKIDALRAEISKTSISRELNLPHVLYFYHKLAALCSKSEINQRDAKPVFTVTNDLWHVPYCAKSAEFGISMWFKLFVERVFVIGFPFGKCDADGSSIIPLGFVSHNYDDGSDLRNDINYPAFYAQYINLFKAIYNHSQTLDVQQIMRAHILCFLMGHEFEYEIDIEEAANGDLLRLINGQKSDADLFKILTQNLRDALTKKSTSPGFETEDAFLIQGSQFGGFMDLMIDAGYAPVLKPDFSNQYSDEAKAYMAQLRTYLFDALDEFEKEFGTLFED